MTKLPTTFLFLMILTSSLVSFGLAFSVGPPSMQQNSLQRMRLASSEDDNIEQETEAPPAPPVKCPNCDLCDGSGRIAGGLAAIPLFDFWPIKAYRPCPNLSSTYSRKGQGLDEIAFGRDSSFKPGQDN